MRRSILFLAASLFALSAGAAEAQHPEVSEVVVTAAPYAVSLDSATTSVAVVEREALDTAPVGGLGDVLSGMTGVRSTFFGPGASRPVIRGLAGPRVLVLSNGLGQVDASALSPDHAVATDPQEAERIEVLRGPSALAYGGSAIGGIVNVIDERIATHRVDGFEGRLLASGSTVDEGRLLSGAVRAGLGDWVLTLDATRRQSDDYQVPTHPESRRLMDADGEEWPGPLDSVVENTATELDSFGSGVSWIGERGHFGASVKRTETTYGVPGHVHEEHEEEEGGVSIQLEQTRYDLRGEYRLGLGPFDTVRFAGGYADYTHVELEGGTPATRFFSQGWEARLDLVQPDRGGWQGAVGLQALSRDFDAQGEEALVPPTRTTEWGAFTLQRYDRDSWGVEGGFRLDRRTLESLPGGRAFTNVSASLAGFVRPAEGWFFSLSGSRTSRAPAQEELFANGPHPATRGFEIGDPDLDQEVSYSLDATLHYGSSAWDTDVHLFAVRYDGFIELAPTGAEEAGLPVFRYMQTDASFHGAEAETSLKLWREGERGFTLEAAADYVRGETDLGPPARIPPWSATVRGLFDGGWWDGRLEIRRVGGQDRVSAFELPTDGYTQLNAMLTFRPLKDRDLKLFVDGRNLTDVEAREHASFLKDLAPLPGRNIRVGLGYRF
ncbi:TonB-dependent receptor domain-containing protein [Phenylobacterium sp.]|jgi:iron complex outermembrane receptor protein|uniref:TonB-dependent receptor domain-containing protein n=1 Tax=Phenylobacterium sp. TaxID=1871053 RepID=UPI002F937415